jgi:hypothetical protein
VQWNKADDAHFGNYDKTNIYIYKLRENTKGQSILVLSFKSTAVDARV